MEIPLFKIRASKGGSIMTESQGKSNYQLYIEAAESLNTKKLQYKKLIKKDGVQGAKWLKEIADLEILIPELEKVKDKVELSETCKTYLSQWIIEKKYGREKEFTSKQTEKGKQTEQDGLQLIQEVLYNGRLFIPKNKIQLEDDYKTGELDAIVREELTTVLDNKSSFTIWTFPFTEKEATNKDYIAQKKIYIDLAKADNGKLCYTLNNTPYAIVEKELRNWCRDNDILDISEMPEREAYGIIKNHVYTREGLIIYSHVLGTYDTSDFIEIPKEKRLKHFDIEKDDAFIQRLHQRVIECRSWIAENWDNF
jgi:hypothetical protein